MTEIIDADQPAQKSRGFKLRRRCKCGQRLWARNGKIVCDKDSCDAPPVVSKATARP